MALDLFEERAAIREEARQPREEAEAAALEEAARAAGTAPDVLRMAWAMEPDAMALAGWLRACHGGTIWQAAEAMSWGTGRTWAAGLAWLDGKGRIRPNDRDPANNHAWQGDGGI